VLLKLSAIADHFIGCRCTRGTFYRWLKLP
jgi:hypothetical protein